MIKELENKFENKKQLSWGFPQATVIIDSQSTAPLRGIEVEQRYYRMYLLAKKGDLVLIDYPINSGYWQYLAELGLDLPKVIRIPNLASPTLSLNAIMDHGPGISVMDYLQYYLQAHQAKLQFFNLSADEITLAKALGNPAYIANLDGVVQLGTKTGFRQFCVENQIPMPNGKIVSSAEEILAYLERIKTNLMVKASAGTGGVELGSNVTLGYSDWQNQTPTSLQLFLQQKLVPAEPPYVVEQKLALPEASLHFFINEKGSVIYPPQIIGQEAPAGSYVGGYYPFSPESASLNNAISLGAKQIIPALAKQGLTGFHCFDFLHDPDTGKVYFIEDNTRPGALDFIDHFVKRTLAAQGLNQVSYAWYHLNTELGHFHKDKTTFQEMSRALGELLDPKSNLAQYFSGFVLISNPDVLPYGYSLHLTAVSVGVGASVDKAKEIHDRAVNFLKKSYNQSYV